MVLGRLMGRNFPPFPAQLITGARDTFQCQAKWQERVTAPMSRSDGWNKPMCLFCVWEKQHHRECFRLPLRPLLGIHRGVWGRARGLSQNLWIMNITNLPLIFKQPLCTKNMSDIKFQTLPQSNIKPMWIVVSFMDSTYARLFSERMKQRFHFLLLVMQSTTMNAGGPFVFI